MTSMMIQGIFATAARSANGVIRSLDGAKWKLPLDLNFDHSYRVIGEVTRIERVGDELHFLATVTDGEIQKRIKAGKLEFVSLEAGHNEEQELRNGTKFVSDWGVTGISLLPENALPGYADARITEVMPGAMPLPQRSAADVIAHNREHGIQYAAPAELKPAPKPKPEFYPLPQLSPADAKAHRDAHGIQYAAPRAPEPEEPAPRQPIKINPPAPEPAPAPQPTPGAAKALALSLVSAQIKEIDAKIKNLIDDPRNNSDGSFYCVTAETLNKLRSKREKLLARQQEIDADLIDIESEAVANDDETTPASSPVEPTTKSAAPHRITSKRRSWDVEDLPEPKYPTGARARGDQAALDEAFKEFCEFETNALARRFSEQDPGRPATLEEALIILGKSNAGFVWLSSRIRELEARVAELQDSQQSFAGVHQRALTYKKGSLVTHQGALWAAVTEAPQGQVPGEASCWQLAVKRGAFDGRSTDAYATRALRLSNDNEDEPK